MNEQHLRILRIALSVIADRLIRILALLAGLVMCSWAMWGPTWERVLTLAIFVLFAYALARTQQPEKRDDVPPDQPAA